jgi:hypothetical protein
VRISSAWTLIFATDGHFDRDIGFDTTFPVLVQALKYSNRVAARKVSAVRTLGFRIDGGVSSIQVPYAKGTEESLRPNLPLKVSILKETGL